MKYTNCYTIVTNKEDLRAIDELLGINHEYLYNSILSCHQISLEDNQHCTDNTWYKKHGYIFIPVEELLGINYEIY